MRLQSSTENGGGGARNRPYVAKGPRRKLREKKRGRGNVSLGKAMCQKVNERLGWEAKKGGISTLRSPKPEGGMVKAAQG